MKTLILGLDAYDPVVFEGLSSQGKLPNLTRYAQSGGYSRFGVADPPQSEVSWTSIATGLNPGSHGIFDFVHRDPASYALRVSLLPTRRGLAGTQFVPPFQARTIFDQVTRQGFPATVLWWPATFPAQPGSPVRTIPGLGTPDIQGRLGVGTLFTTETQPVNQDRKTPIEVLAQQGKDHFVGQLKGPLRKKRGGAQESALVVQLLLKGDHAAHVKIGKQAIELVEGKWSPILELSFRLAPWVSVRAITRAILTRVQPDVRLYFLPLQLHPLHSPWRYASPRAFVKRTWQGCGPFLTLGWQQDTTGLEEGCINDEQFLELCDAILETRVCVLFHQLQNFREGILAVVFDSLDRVQHMFWRDRPDIIEAWYVKLDALLGRVERQLAKSGGEPTSIVVVSDHGFANFDYKVHLNRWLIDQGYLASRTQDGHGSLRDVDWSQSQAYAVGLNSVYINLQGREGQGCVPASEYEPLVHRLRDQMPDWYGPDGRRVIKHAKSRSEVFEGPLSQYGPDLVVGYSPAYRASSETGLGRWERNSIERNRDHWGGDHCMDQASVPGVLFSNRSLADFTNPSYRDIPTLTIGAEPEVSDVPPSLSWSEEDEEIVEERLRGLGYL